VARLRVLTPPETTEKPCDVGTPVSELTREFPGFDFSGLDPVYPDKTSPKGSRYHFTRGAILARGQECLQSLYDRPEKVIVVVSHSAFLRSGVSGRWYANTDFRIFDFAESSAEQHREVDGRLNGDGDRDQDRDELVNGNRSRDEDELFELKEWEVTKGAGGLGISDPAPVELGWKLPELRPMRL
jgi:hypothetical protein